MRGDFQRDLELHKLIVRSLGYVKRRKSIIMVMVMVKVKRMKPRVLKPYTRPRPFLNPGT